MMIKIQIFVWMENNQLQILMISIMNQYIMLNNHNNMMIKIVAIINMFKNISKICTCILYIYFTVTQCLYYIKYYYYLLTFIFMAFNHCLLCLYTKNLRIRYYLTLYQIIIFYYTIIYTHFKSCKILSSTGENK